MSTAIIIPARLNSKRFPNKMLAQMGNGKILIRHVYEKCLSFGYDVYVATDSVEIAREIGYNVIKTSMLHENGTSRCSEAAERLNYEYFVNVQGDMPDITKEVVDAVVDTVIESKGVATAYSKNSSSVKVTHTNGVAHWFSRHIPYGDGHLGVYGYTRDALINYRMLKKYPEEDIESLEQLRWLQNGIKMSVAQVEFSGCEINTPADLEKWKS